MHYSVHLVISGLVVCSPSVTSELGLRAKPFQTLSLYIYI